MRIAVLGATGPTGKAFIRLALERGHEITALARTPERLDEFSGISIVPGDALVAADIAATIEGADAVFSSLGLSAAGSADEVVEVCTIAMTHTLRLMPEVGVNRLLVMSTHGVGDSNDGSDYSDTLWTRMGERLRDKETMEKLFTDSSSIDWTIVRAPRISEGPATGEFRVAERLEVPVDGHIAREDLVRFVVGELEHPEHVHERVSIAE